MIDVYMIFGPPGSGKSFILNYFEGQNSISTGNILRSMGLAKQDGTLVEDVVVNKILINNLLERADSGFVILDGYPRRTEQAKFLRYLEKMGLIRPKMFIELDCTDENALDRTCNRLLCSCGETYHPKLKPSKIENECDKCHGELYQRNDDTIQTVGHRLNLYRAQKKEVKSYFADIVHTIDVNENPKQGLQVVLGLLQKSICCPKNHIKHPLAAKLAHQGKSHIK